MLLKGFISRNDATASLPVDLISAPQIAKDCDLESNISSEVRLLCNFFTLRINLKILFIACSRQLDIVRVHIGIWCQSPPNVLMEPAHASLVQCSVIFLTLLKLVEYHMCNTSIHMYSYVDR